MRRDLRGRVALITGASRGIGRRVATRFADRGARLALVARSADELESFARELKGRGADCEAFPADLTNPDDRKRVVGETVRRFGGLDVLVNAAGVCSFGEFATSSPDILRKLMAINFFAPAELIRLCVPHLAKSDKEPVIVNVASVAGRCGIPSFSEHAASKHALVGLTESLRVELVRFGIDVVLVLPGLVRTDDLDKHLLRNEGKLAINYDQGQSPDSVADGIVRAAISNRAEAPLGWVGWWICRGKRMWPRFVRWVLIRKARRFQS
jgi:NAD(P)-dependent dehydrogenase (short-subunit alcohol dehydrogenase family)